MLLLSLLLLLLQPKKTELLLLLLQPKKTELLLLLLQPQKTELLLLLFLVLLSLLYYCNYIIIMSKEAYKEKCLEILTVGENYEETDMSKDVLQQIVEKELKKVRSLKASLPTDIYKGLIRKNAKLPEFYGLPKTQEYL